MRKAFQRCSSSLPLAFSSLPSNGAFRAQYALRSNVRRSALQSSRIYIRQISQSSRNNQQAVARQDDNLIPDQDDELVTRFDQLQSSSKVHPNVVRALTQDMGLHTMTEVQTKTINEALRGDDTIAQAKTGTGKTLAFLIPILQRIISVDPQLAQPSSNPRGPRTTADDIRAIIISPTRELAEQIAMEANKVVRHTGIIVQTAVGGTHKRQGLDRIQRRGCHILIGTPGRLKDILSDEYSRVEAPDLSALVMDEADRLMDQGFWPEIQEIMRYLPTPHEKDRQTMMFSATVPKEVVSLVRSALKPGFQFVQCVREDEDPTHSNVDQRVVTVLGFENALPALMELCQRGIDASRQPGGKPFKALVYFNSTAEVHLASSMLNGLTQPNQPTSDAFGSRRGQHPWAPARVLEIHAKLSQSQRTAASDAFRQAESGILLSSDVTARGLDFPNVSHVIQVGLPQSRDQYVHRVGRTARAGKEGEAWLFLNQLEAQEARTRLRGLPVKKDTSIETAKLDLTKEAQVPVAAGRLLSMYQNAMRRVLPADKKAVYKAQIGVYQWHNDKAALVEHMNNLAKYGWGMAQPPMLSPMLAQRLRLDRIPGINIGIDPDQERPRNPPGGGGRYSSGGFGGRGGFGDRQDAFGGRGGGDRYGGRGGGDRFGGRRESFDSRGPPRSRPQRQDDPFGM